MTGEECLKLTTYFGERDRSEGRLLADQLLDLYAAHRLRASILLRGAAGFGRQHRLHTDQLLSLSEDLPAVAIAVDRRERIEALLESLSLLGQPGLITVERARLLTDEIDAVRVPEELHEATKLTVYVGRRERAGQAPAFAAVCDLLHRHGVAGATALLGVDGTRRGRRTRARFFGGNGEVPTMIVTVGAGEVISRALPELGGILREPLITLERVRVCKRDGQRLARPHALPTHDAAGLPMWQKLSVYTSQSATWEGRPLNLEIIRRLRRSRGTGATSLRGIWGFHGDHRPHGDRVMQLRRHVPVLTVSIVAPERTADAFDIIDELTTKHGLVTSEMVPGLGGMGAGTDGPPRLASHRF